MQALLICKMEAAQASDPSPNDIKPDGLCQSAPFISFAEEELLMPTLTVGESAVFACQMASAGCRAASAASALAPQTILERLGLAEQWHTQVCTRVRVWGTCRCVHAGAHTQVYTQFRWRAPGLG